MARRRAIDLAAVRHCYVEAHLTAAETAVRLGCAATTISRRLRELGIAPRARGPAREGRAARVTWSPEIAYAVGLIATDGNLSRNGRGLTFTSREIEQIAAFTRCLGLRVPISAVRTGFGSACFRVQWSDRGFHQWLRDLGLIPAKSLSLGPLSVPDPYFVDFFRGCLDGDGSVLTYVDTHHASKRRTYVYERLYVRLYSASPGVLRWTQSTVHRLLGVAGSVRIETQRRGAPKGRLCYAKGESLRLLRWIYYSADVPCLARKRAKAEPFLSRWRPGILAADTHRRPGRPLLLDGVAGADEDVDEPRRT